MNRIKRGNNAPPFMIMLCGLPGSGKSTFAQTITILKDGYTLPPIIHSSDEIRKELFGDESNQSNPNDVFNLLHKRVIRDLRAGRDVVYDATNINKKQRIHLLRKLEGIDCVPIAIVMAVPYEECLARNDSRERKVPADVIRRMYMNWEPPHYGEGFNDITYEFSKERYDEYTLGKFLSKAMVFDQENKHHSLTLGEHCNKASDYISLRQSGNFMLYIAAKLHDNGKLFTKSYLNRKGVNDGNCHYYQHQQTGSYDSMFYMDGITGRNDAKITYVANLIYYHMHPYIQWKQSERCIKRDKALLGEKMYNDILILHEADLYAH